MQRLKWMRSWMPSLVDLPKPLKMQWLSWIKKLCTCGSQCWCEFELDCLLAFFRLTSLHGQPLLCSLELCYSWERTLWYRVIWVFWGLGLWDWVYATFVLSIFVSETFFLSPSVDVGQRPNHVNPWCSLLCVVVYFSFVFFSLIIFICEISSSTTFGSFRSTGKAAEGDDLINADFTDSE